MLKLKIGGHGRRGEGTHVENGKGNLEIGHQSSGICNSKICDVGSPVFQIPRPDQR